MTRRMWIIFLAGVGLSLSGSALAAGDAPSLSAHQPPLWTEQAEGAALDERDPCEVICQPADMMECPEVPGPYHYLEDCDGGCHRVPPTFQHIEPDWPVCGVGFTYTCDNGSNCRDTDWFEFFLPAYATVQMEMVAEFPVLFGIVSLPCETADFISYGLQPLPCAPLVIATPCLPPGSYVAWVGPIDFTGVPTPMTFRFTVSYQLCPPPCAGTIELATHELVFSPTYIEGISSASVLVTNIGSENLCVNSVTTTGHIWQASPSTFTLGPGLSQPVQIDFLPTFEHDFEGTIEFFSSDPERPRDSISVFGLGCHPVAMPLPPTLMDAGSASMIYFALPWDGNGLKTEYAIEYSSDGFVTSQFVSLTEFSVEEAEWQTAQAWGYESAGAIVGLEPNTTYQVRLQARDCTGLILTGSPAMMTTLPEIVVASEPELTLMWIDADTVELNWNPVVLDPAGQLIPNFGFVVYMGSEPGLIDSMIGSSSSGKLRIGTGETTTGFFYVEPIIAGVYDECRPFISWPPEMAVISGMNSVVLQDFAHLMWWDSFRVEVDSAGVSVLIGSNSDDPWLFGGTRAAAADFNRFEPGLHTITATVVDRQNRSWIAMRQVMVVPSPWSTYQAAYDPVHQIFTLDTLDVTGVTGPIAEMYWPISTAGERYGGTIQFEWNPGRDSMTMVIPFLQPVQKTLTDDPQWVSLSDPVVGVVPVPEQPEVPAAEAGICCLSLDVVDQGPVVQCEKGGYFVGYNFRIEVKWKPWHSPPPTFGQEAKGTRTYTKGKCKWNPPRFIPLAGDAGKPDSTYKEDENGSHPYDCPCWGHDDYRPNDRHNHRMGGDIRRGRTWWQDRPHDKGTANDNAMRCTGKNKFRAWARTRCPIPPGCVCCKEFEIEWDVTFCKGCERDSGVIQTTPPRLFNLRACPDE